MKSWGRVHGHYLATVFQHGESDFSAIGQAVNETKGTTQHLPTLEVAQREADDQVQTDVASLVR